MDKPYFLVEVETRGRLPDGRKGIVKNTYKVTDASKEYEAEYLIQREHERKGHSVLSVKATRVPPLEPKKLSPALAAIMRNRGSGSRAIG